MKRAGRWLAGALCLGAALAGAPVSATPLVYENQFEFYAAGDFNGDGILDVLVLDKITGNARVGYQSTNGVLTWSPPLVTGVDYATGCAAGRFLATGRDAVAVTSAELNLVKLVDLSNTNSAGSPVIVTPPGIGPHSLAALASPLGAAPPAYNFLLAASSFNAPPNERLDLLGLNAGVATPNGQFNESGRFDRPNALDLGTNYPTLSAGIARGATNDTLDIWQFTNAPAILLSASNLPPGSDYAFGQFNGEALPRFIFYVPGQSNATVQQLLQTNGTLVFGPALSITFTGAVQQIFYTAVGADGAFQLNYGNAIQSLGLPGGVASFGPTYAASAGSMFMGLVPLAGGNFALMDAPIGATSSAHAQVVQFNGSNYTPVSSGNMPTTTARGTRPNVWLFRTEPFVSVNPGFIVSLTAPDWTVGVNGLPGSISALTETDSGAGTGLSLAPGTNNLGAAPSGAAFALPNQYLDVISIFSYASPRPVQPITVAISPPPGTYSGPVQVLFTTLNLGDQVFYQAGSADTWHSYSSPFTLTYDTTVQYYGTNSASAARSRLQSAAYALANGAAPQSPFFINPDGTNPPAINTNAIVLSTGGTIFYGRRNGNTGTIWCINADGSGETYITSGARPRVSRDAHWLAFMRDNNPFANTGNLYLRNLVNGTETLLVANSNAIVCYDWDITGTNLVFDYNCHLYEIGLSGPATQLTPSPYCNKDAPVVNPVDGRLAYFSLNPNGPGIYVTATNNRASDQLLSLSASTPLWPAWSPSGSAIAFASGSSSSPSIDGGRDLYITSPNGTNVHQITGIGDGTNGFPHGVTWSADGSALIGAGTIYGTNGIWIIPLTPDLSACDCPQPLAPVPVSPGDPIDFVGSVVAAPVVVNTNHPGLFIRLDPNMVVVYWNTNLQGYTLESSPNILPTAWASIDGPYFLNGIYYEHREPRASLLAQKFFRLSYTGAMIVTPAQPVIDVQYLGGQILLTWPTNYLGYRLQSATSLRPPATWTSLGINFGITNDTFLYQEAVSGKAAKFFRLVYP